MPANSIPLNISGRVAASAIGEFWPIRADGQPASSGEAIIGFTQASAPAGSRVPVAVDGSTIAWAGTAISDGDWLQVGTGGTVVPYAGGAVVGRALNAALAGEKVECLLFCYRQGDGADERVGQIATACELNNWTNGSNKQMMSRKMHKARDNMYGFKIAYGNWYCALQVAPSNGTEANNGADSTITASIEYPVGTFTRVTFGGSASGTVPAGSTLFSDEINVFIPNGATFYVRLWTKNATGLVYNNNHIAMTGEMNAYGVTTPDLTMGGSFATATNIMQAPCAIIGVTSKPSVWLAGDSRMQGIKDTGDASGNVGEGARSIGNQFAYINAGVASDRVQLAAANYTRRLALAQYCTHVVSNYGINDNRSNGGNRTSAQVITDLNTFAGLFGGKPFYQCTIPSYTSSTDGWTTTANQSTAINTNHAQLLVLNDSIRGGSINACWGVFDLYNICTPTGVWVPNFTDDGLHELRRGALAIQSSAVLNPGIIA